MLQDGGHASAEAHASTSPGTSPSGSCPTASSSSKRFPALPPGKFEIELRNLFYDSLKGNKQMSRYDITQTNRAVERLIESTDNPRHLYMLHSYNRHRYLEMAGRYEEIFART